MATKDEFAEIRKDGGSRGECHFCDAEATAYVEVRVRERKTKKQVTSKTISTCGPHTVELFQGFEEKIKEMGQ